MGATGPMSTERGRPRLSPRLLLIPTCCTVATTAMDLATTAATTAMDWPTTERGRLRPSPRLLLIPTCCTVATDSATGPTAYSYGGYYGHGLGYGYGYGLGYRAYWG